jgi:hypothetical protein
MTDELFMHRAGNPGFSVEDLIQQSGDVGRYGVASNSLVRAVNARRLGWSPKAPSLVEYFAAMNVRKEGYR